jgi:hypothetical protein
MTGTLNRIKGSENSKGSQWVCEARRALVTLVPRTRVAFEKLTLSRSVCASETTELVRTGGRENAPGHGIPANFCTPWPISEVRETGEGPESAAHRERPALCEEFCAAAAARSED